MLNSAGDNTRRLVGDYAKLAPVELSLLNALGMTPQGRESVGANATRDVLDLEHFLLSESATSV